VKYQVDDEYVFAWLDIMDKSREIHDLIQTFQIECNQKAISGLLDILDALNRRMDDIESARTAEGARSDSARELKERPHAA